MCGSSQRHFVYELRARSGGKSIRPWPPYSAHLELTYTRTAHHTSLLCLWPSRPRLPYRALLCLPRVGACAKPTHSLGCSRTAAGAHQRSSVNEPLRLARCGVEGQGGPAPGPGVWALGWGWPKEQRLVSGASIVWPSFSRYERAARPWTGLMSCGCALCASLSPSSPSSLSCAPAPRARSLQS